MIAPRAELARTMVVLRERLKSGQDGIFACRDVLAGLLASGAVVRFVNAELRKLQDRPTRPARFEMGADRLILAGMCSET